MSQYVVVRCSDFFSCCTLWCSVCSSMSHCIAVNFNIFNHTHSTWYTHAKMLKKNLHLYLNMCICVRCKKIALPQHVYICRRCIYVTMCCSYDLCIYVTMCCSYDSTSKTKHTHKKEWALHRHTCHKERNVLHWIQCLMMRTCCRLRCR